MVVEKSQKRLFQCDGRKEEEEEEEAASEPHTFLFMWWYIYLSFSRDSRKPHAIPYTFFLVGFSTESYI